MTETHPLTVEWQIEQLSKLVDTWAVQESRHVRGSFTSGDYVEYQLRRIFGPHRWSFTILEAPRIVEVAAAEGYAQTVGRLEATFCDGSCVTQDAVGVWPLKASNARSGGTLEDTASERYETVLKAACTDALKAAAERIGSCFRPISDLQVKEAIQRAAYERARPNVDTAFGQQLLSQEPDPLDTPTPNPKEKAEGLFSSPPTSTTYWSIVAEMKKLGMMTHSQAVDIKSESDEELDQTDWAGAIKRLGEIYHAKS